MNRFTTKTTADGSQTFILDQARGGATWCVCSQKTHQADAERTARALNLDERVTLGRPVKEATE